MTIWGGVFSFASEDARPFGRKFCNTGNIENHSAIRAIWFTARILRSQRWTGVSFMSRCGLQCTLLWSPLDQLILCPSGPTLPGDSKISDFQGSRKSELIGQVPRVPINRPSKTSSLICPFFSPQCLTSFHLSMLSYFFLRQLHSPHISAPCIGLWRM